MQICVTRPQCVNWDWPCFWVFVQDMTWSRRLIWPAVFNIRYEIFMNNEIYFVRCFALQLRITLHCRIDDIQDNSALRRGIPTAHTVYGIASTISAAMCVYFKSMQLVLRFNHPDCIKFYTGMLLELWRGQAIEIYWRDNHTCPSEEEYLDMVNRSKYRVRAMCRICWTCVLLKYLGMCGVYQSAWCLWTYSLIFCIPNVLNCSGLHCVCILEKNFKLFPFPQLFSILNTKYQYINS